MTENINLPDGEEIAKEIKTRFPNITVIGNVSKPLVNADINCPKSDGPRKLEEAVRNA